jgi:hypothetical protein
MNSPTRSPFPQTTSRMTSIIEEISSMSPRSIPNCNELEISIHSLQSKIYDSLLFFGKFLEKRGSYFCPNKLKGSDVVLLMYLS